MDLLLGLGLVERFDQLGVAAARPRPAPNLPDRFFVDSDQHDLPLTGRSLM
jgi:hypothetical protein